MSPNKHFFFLYQMTFVMQLIHYYFFTAIFKIFGFYAMMAPEKGTRDGKERKKYIYDETERQLSNGSFILAAE